MHHSAKTPPTENVSRRRKTFRIFKRFWYLSLTRLGFYLKAVFVFSGGGWVNLIFPPPPPGKTPLWYNIDDVTQGFLISGRLWSGSQWSVVTILSEYYWVRFLGYDRLVIVCFYWLFMVKWDLDVVYLLFNV